MSRKLRPFLIFTLVFCAYNCYAASLHGVDVAVFDVLTVTRGGYISLNGMYKVIYNSSEIDQCKVLFSITAGHPCGIVIPSSLPCNANGSIYHHYGCFAQYETLNFQVELKTKIYNKLITELFSISVNIANSPSSIKIFKDTVALQPHISLTFLFPSSYVNYCSYILHTNHSILQLPMKGTLSGLINYPLPCGYYSPKSQFLYHPYSNNTEDVLFIETNCLTEERPRYSLIQLKHTTSHILYLPKAYLYVYELMETVIPMDLLPIATLSQQYQFLELTFPVQLTGGVFSVYSFNKGFMDATTFTLIDLQLGIVTFRPKETSLTSYVSTLSHYHYYVSEITGQPVAEGVLEVKLYPRVGMRPSIRKNIGLTVRSGASKFLTSEHLNFYPPGKCVNYTITIVTTPLKGTLMNALGVPLTYNTNLNVTENDLNVLYQHNTSFTGSMDFTRWTIQCNGYRPQTQMSILITFKILTSSAQVIHCNCSVMTYPGFVIPLHLFSKEKCRLPAGIGKVLLQQPKLGQLFPWLQTCNYRRYMSKNNKYPFIDYRDIPWNTSCINTTLQYVNLNNLWYLSPISVASTNEIVRLLFVPDNDNNINGSITFNISIVNNSSVETDFKKIPSIYSPTPNQKTIPYIKRNHPLPLITSAGTYISSQHLYVHSLGYLQREIIYHITTQPQYGYICLLYQAKCRHSVLSFTQEDILIGRVYYQLHQDRSQLLNDSFQFLIFYPTQMRLPETFKFTIQVIENYDLQNFKQFWLLRGRRKPLSPKYLRQFQKHFKTSKLRFIVVQKPLYGQLEMPNLNEFSWQESKQREVIYHHSGTKLCSDFIRLEVTDNLTSIEANLTIAIRLHPSITLDLYTKEHELQSANAFTLSATDLKIDSSFCPQFVTLQVITIPTYGILQVRDTKYGISRHLSINDSFSGLDIQQGRINYVVFPDLSFMDKTQDSFEVILKDPRGLSRPKSGSSPKVIRSVDGNVYRIVVIIFDPQGAVTFNLSIISPKLINKLSNNQHGAVFDSKDMYLANDNFLPSEVVFRIHQLPRFGQLQKDKVPVGEFSLADVHEGKISYISSLTHSETDVTSDEFRFSVIISTMGGFVTSDESFTLEWCYFTLDPSTNQIVEEKLESTQFVVRRIGLNTSLPVSVNFTTQEDGTTYGVNCSEFNGTLPAWGDFCNINTNITFESGRTKKTVSIPIIDNLIAEGPESFKVFLQDPRGCLIPKWSEVKVFITDYEDYSFIKFSKDQHQNERIPIKTCPIQLTVKEDIKEVNITLVRTGNLNQTDGVICHTENVTPPKYISYDYIPRPPNASSIVYFKPGQQLSNCTVKIHNDHINEPHEHFFVKIGKSYGFAIEDSSSPVCVFIDHDIEDVPLVFFESTQIIVKESRHANVIATFIIRRNGSDLNGITAVNCQTLVSKGNATAGDDYIYESHIIKFTTGQKEASGTVTILPDTIREGTEVLYILMTTPYNGRRASSELEIVIIDAMEAMVVELSSTKYHVYETSGAVQFPIYRHGNLTVSTNVTCIVESLTADTFVDFFYLGELIVFPPNTTERECTVFILDDFKREGDEEFTVTIVTKDPTVRISTSKATVIISDPEDVPQVQFQHFTYYIKEPLSNNPIDYTEVTLTLQRGGGTSLNSSISYYTIDGTAEANVDYTHQEGQVYFLEDVTEKYISIQIHANHRYHSNSWFYIQLYIEDDNDLDVRLGPKNKTKIIIQNTLLNGVYFPAEPQIQSFIEDNNLVAAVNNTLYYDQPLICVTPCDNYYTISDDSITSYITKCKEQDIDSKQTIYKWQISDDGLHFRELKTDTLFTSTRSQVLESLYLQFGIWIKCSTTAVDKSGVKGYTRTSTPVMLNNTFVKCESHSDSINITLNTYNAFYGNNEDLIQMLIDLPAIPNTLPLLTTLPINEENILSLLTNPAIRRSHQCSTLISNGKSHLIIPGLLSQFTNTLRPLKSYILYKHYLPHQCHWMFSIWLPVQELLNSCKANLTLDPLTLSFPVHITYVTITNGTAIVVAQSQHTAILQHTSLPVNIILPFDYLPSSPVDNKEQLLKLLAIERIPETNRLLLVMYSQSNRITSNNIMMVSNETDVFYPKYSWKKNNTLIEAWTMEINTQGNNNYNISLKLRSCHTVNGFQACKVYTFEIPIVIENETGLSLRMGLRLRTSVTKVNTTDLMSDIKITGQHIVMITIQLDPTFILRDNYTLAVSTVKFCYTKDDGELTEEMGGCSHKTVDNITEVSDFENDDQYHLRIAQRTNHLLYLYFKLDHLQYSCPRKQYIDVVYSVKSTDHISVTSKDLVLVLPTFTASVNPTSHYSSVIVTQTFVPVVKQSETMPLYASILILIALVVFVSVCSITMILFFYTLCQRWLLKKQESKIKDGGPQEPVMKEPDNVRVKRLPRSHRVYPRWHKTPHNLSLSLPRRGFDKSFSDVSRPKLTRSASLPNLSSLKEEKNTTVSTTTNGLINHLQMLPKKEQRNVLIATVKPLTSSTSLASNCYTTAKPAVVSPPLTSKESLSSSLKTHPFTRHLSYRPQGVGWYERYQARQKSLQSYAQIYLAAGAKTPEPGISPSTAL